MEILVLYKSIIEDIRTLEILKKEIERSLRMENKEYLENRIIDIMTVSNAIAEHSEELRKML